MDVLRNKQEPQITQEFVGHDEDFGFYPKYNKKPLVGGG